MSVGCTGATMIIIIMRPESCRNILKLFILVELILTVNADGDECTEEIRVRRNTNYEASVEDELRIKCPVVFCNNSPPTVTWFKLEKTSVPVNSSNRVKLEWRTTNQQEGVSYLIFYNIFKSDAGTYRCGGGGSMSHNIYITVKDENTNDTSTERAKTTTDGSPGISDNLMMYVYSAAAIGAFVFIVIIVSVISMRGCKGKSHKEPEKENQYMELPAIEQPAPQHSPRGSPNPPPSRRSSEKKTPRRPEEVTTSGNNKHLYGQVKENRNSKGNVAPSEEPGSVVYAALNHQQPPRTGARAQVLVEDTEYAAIRLG